MKRILFWGLIMPTVLRRLLPKAVFEPPLLVVARHPWLALGGLALALVIAGLAFWASGLMPLQARSGHWPITNRFLQFTMQRSVKTHALAITPPPLQDDDALLLRGATHFDLGCRPCHGSIRDDRPQVALAMLPPPPALPPRVDHWTSAQLFYIVKHGVKFTGMPAWPEQQRDDEVWAVVAFLRRMPHMSQDEYLSLARGESGTTLALGGEGEPPPEIVRESCARCHGLDGQGRGTGGFPVLAGQRPEYMRRALRAYADRRRHSGVMGTVVSGQTAAALDEAVRFYAALAPRRPTVMPTIPGADPSRGAALAMRGIPARDIPACIECHGPAAHEKNPAYPILAGQDATYLELQLRLLRERRRGGSEYVHLMHSFIDRLSPADIGAAAAYFAGLDPGAAASAAAAQDRRVP
jgi:cytochrome c553